MTAAHGLPVLVVGAGPVGLLTALCLQLRNVPVRVLERRRERAHGSRASSFQPPVLDRLADLGLLEALEPLGRRVERIASWDLARGDRRALSLALLAGRTAHPYRLHLEQQHLLAALEARLEALAPGCLVRGMEVFGFDAAGPGGDGGAVRLLARDGGGDLHQFTGAWIVAADGAHSRLRQAAGLAFPGQDAAAPVVRLFVPRFPDRLERRLAPLTYVRRGAHSLSVLQMRDGWRVILRPAPAEVAAALACDPSLEGQPAQASAWALARLRSVLAEELEEGTWSPGPIGQDHYPVRQRRVERHRLGRLLLVGDAAHVTNTRGGLNMNFGLLEGLALTEALARRWSAARDRADGDGSDADCCCQAEPDGSPAAAIAGRPAEPSGAEALWAWAERWQRLTSSVLLPRTAAMRGVGTLFDLPAAACSGPSSGSSGGPLLPQGSPDLVELLTRATLLDLAPPPDLRP